VRKKTNRTNALATILIIFVGLLVVFWVVSVLF